MDEQALQAANDAVVWLKAAGTVLGLCVGVIGVFLYDDRSRLRQLENEAVRKADIDQLVALAVVKFIELQNGVQHG